MITTIYKVECVTNLHIGSSDENFNIVDNEVEKDAITGMPIMNASSIKGALREMFAVQDEAFANEVFGTRRSRESLGTGTHKFLDGLLLARPMRVAGSEQMASIPVVTVASVNQFLSLLSAFGKNPWPFDKVVAPDFGGKAFLSNVPNVKIENEETGVLEGDILEKLTAMSHMFGEHFALAATYDGFDLPVIARNHLANGISKKLWFEEMVPRGSVFYFGTMAYDGCRMLEIPEIIQLGGHASIGFGFCKVTKL